MKVQSAPPRLFPPRKKTKRQLVLCKYEINRNKMVRFLFNEFVTNETSPEMDFNSKISSI